MCSTATPDVRTACEIAAMYTKDQAQQLKKQSVAQRATIVSSLNDESKRLLLEEMAPQDRKTTLACDLTACNDSHCCLRPCVTVCTVCALLVVSTLSICTVC